MFYIYEVSKGIDYTFVITETKESHPAFPKGEGWRYHFILANQSLYEAQGALSFYNQNEEGSAGFYASPLDLPRDTLPK